MASKKPWADGPWELIPIPDTDPTSHPAHELTHLMCGLHNTFFRAINSAYLQAPYVRSVSDLQDLARYISCWIYIVHKHHAAEETVGFPGLVRISGGEWSDLSSQNLKQHEALDSKLDDLAAWCEDSTKPNWTTVLRTKIEEAMEVVTVHLREEIPTMQALVKYDKADVREVIDVIEKEVEAKTDFYRDMPMMLGCHDVTFSASKASFPSIPFFIRYIDYYIWERSARGVWRFNPCDAWGRPRDLHFLP